MIIPGAAVLTALFDFLFAFLIFAVFCLIYKQPFSWQAIFLIPAAICLTLVTAFGSSVFLSALTVKYRDFRYVIPFGLQFLFFATQVIYPLQMISSSSLKLILGFNPLNAALALFRAAFNNGPADPVILWEGTGVAFLILIAGVFYFRKTESYFADLA